MTYDAELGLSALTPTPDKDRDMRSAPARGSHSTSGLSLCGRDHLVVAVPRREEDEALDPHLLGRDARALIFKRPRR